MKTEKIIAAGVKQRDGDEGLQRFKFLYEEYEPRCWWFAVVELIRRLYLTGLLAFFGSDEEPTTTTQTSLGLLGAFVYFVVISHFDPYIEQSDDTLAKVAAIQVVLTFFGATMLQARSNSDDEEAGDPQGVFQGAIFADSSALAKVKSLCRHEPARQSLQLNNKLSLSARYYATVQQYKL